MIVTYSDSSDYLELNSSNNPLVAFTSDPSTHRQCFNVNITDDLILEDTERFSLTLTLADGNVPVVVDPDVSEVDIVDDDGLLSVYENSNVKFECFSSSDLCWICGNVYSCQ